MFVCAYECAGWLLIPLLSVAAIEVSARERRAVMGTTRQGIGLKVERPLLFPKPPTPRETEPE